jgi:hypothetical protein
VDLCNDPAFGASPEADGISFDQVTPFADWVADVVVDLNGVAQAPGTWSVTRTNVPFDQLAFAFSGFVVAPGDVLSLHFTMRDFQNNRWFLRQEATVPEPATILTAGLALLGLRADRRIAGRRS